MIPIRTGLRLKILSKFSSACLRSLAIDVSRHGSPGTFAVGNYKYDAAYLKKLEKGKGEKYFLPNAKIFLDGCLAAKGPEGTEFLYQIGRVFLGEKHGFIQGNTREVIAYGHMVAKDPVRLAYPAHVVVPATN